MALSPTLNPVRIGSSAPAQRSPSSLPSSPNKSLATITNPDLYRILNEVVPLDECEVYSWFPEPEYDPHIDAEDGEASEDGLNADEEAEILTGVARVKGMNVDADIPASWGQGGMELDDVPTSVPMTRTLSRSGKAGRKREDDAMGEDVTVDWEGRGGRKGGLLWSANYFFYSK